MPNNAIAAAIEALAADHARYTPSPDELAAAPLITNYTISPTELGGRYRLEGTVQGHPVVGDTLVGTSPIMAMDPLMMWRERGAGTTALAKPSGRRAMREMVIETEALVEAALAGDPAVESLTISGPNPLMLIASIDPGTPPSKIGGTEYGPKPPFSREILLELIVRMQRKRWERVDDLVLGLVPPASDEWKRVAVQTGVMPEAGSGWTDLFLAASELIVEHGGEPSATQIKEKYGQARFYTKGLEGAVGEEIVEALEHLSAHVCEVCGALGSLRERRGWMRTRCDEHANA